MLTICQAVYSIVHMYYFISFIQQKYKVGAIMILIWLMRRVRHRDQMTYSSLHSYEVAETSYEYRQFDSRAHGLNDLAH